MPMTGTMEEVVEAGKAVGTVEANEIAKVGEESKGEYSNRVQVLCLRYHITFWKKSMSMSRLFESGGEINAMHLTFAWELGLPSRPTNVEAQKIDGIMLNIFRMVVTAFSVIDKVN